MQSFFKVFNTLIYIVLLLSFIQCKTVQNDKCVGTSEALIIDMSSVGGCQDLLLLSDGTKIQPILGKKATALIKSKIISFNYTKASTKPTCSSADFAAKITCITYQERKAVQECIGETEINKISWMKPLLKKAGLKSIYLLTKSDQYLYQVKYDIQNDIYNCDGDKICTFKKGSTNECSSKLLKDINRKAIFVNEGRPH